MPFIWRNGVMTDLGTLDGHASSCADDVNANGTVVGRSIDDSPENYAVVWRNGQVADLSDGIAGSAAQAINNQGVIVGDTDAGGVIWTWKASEREATHPAIPKSGTGNGSLISAVVWPGVWRFLAEALDLSFLGISAS